MSTTIIDTYSDLDMQDPAEYHNGFKEARILRSGIADRSLSDLRTGQHKGAHYVYELSDYDRRFREYSVSAAHRYWTPPVEVYMTNRANRAVLGLPYPVFVGPIVSSRPTRPLGWEFTLGDIVTQGLLADDVQIPWRTVGDGFLSELTTIAQDLDLTRPEPIIYGQHRRLVDTDPPSPQGFAFPPIYLGTETIDGDEWYVWMIAGHACAAVPNVLVKDVNDEDAPWVSVLADEGTDWLIPGQAGHTGIFTTSYEDRRSDTYGNLRRYTLLRGKKGSTDPDAVVNGEKELVVFVDGVEPNADGTGAVITDRLLQYKHFVINFIANQGPDSYMSGAWLTTPIRSLFDRSVPVVDESSFDACAEIGVERMPFDPVNADYPGGYIGAGVIGATPGDRASAVTWLAHWNVSCHTQHGFTATGQFRVTTLHPTQAIKDAAPTLTATWEILKDSFDVTLDYEAQSTAIPYVTDLHYDSGTWRTKGIARADQATINYGKEITGEERQYRFAPGIAMADHLAVLDVRELQHPPIGMVLRATVGPDAEGQSLGYVDLGDYVNIEHFASVGVRGLALLGQIQRHQVDTEKREVLIEVRLCESFIGYDAPAPPAAAEGDASAACTLAEVIPPESEVYFRAVNTSANPTDPDVTGFGGSNVAYKAQWFSFTPPVNGTFEADTLGSDYDTQMAFFEGACDALAQVGFNDNMHPATTASGLTVPASAGVPIKILVAGYADVGGNLAFTARWFPDTEAPSAPVGGAVYVSLSGSDSNPGTEGSPKRTVRAAVAIATPGQTVYLRGGTYTTADDVIDSALYTVPSGTSWAAPITIAGYPGESVTLQPPHNTHALRLTDGAPSYLICQDFTLDYVNDTSERECIYVGSGAHHNRFLRLEVKNGANFGVVFSDTVDNSPFNEVINCHIHHMRDLSTGAADNTKGHGVYVTTSDNLFDGNTIHDNAGYGCHLYENSGPENVARNVIRNNRIYNNGLGHGTAFGVVVAWGSGNVIYNNLIYGNKGGVQVYTNSRSAGVYNNTIVSNVNQGLHLQGYAVPPTARNNILYGNGSAILDSGGTGTPTLSHNLTSNPLFGSDYSLTASSPARDAGTTVSVVVSDFNGVSRPQGSAYCIGAKEFV